MTEAAFDADDFRASVVQPLWRGAAKLSFFVIGFMLWAVFAELSTTVRVSGHVSAETPRHHVQHIAGGRVSEVQVALRQTVEAGALMFRFDVAAERETLAEINVRIERMEAENQLIRNELDIPTHSPTPAVDAATRDRFNSQKSVVGLSIATERNAIAAAKDRRERLQTERDLTQERVALQRKRLAALDGLTERGLTRVVERDEVAAMALSLEADLQALAAEERGLEERIKQAWLAIYAARATGRATLSEKLDANMRRLSELRSQAASLRPVIQGADVRAPFSGMVTELNFASPGMVARAGESMAVLAEPLDRPNLELRIPINHIDQVGPGMSGRITFNALGQRDMPDISVTVTSVSGEATRAPDGTALYYSASAEITARDLEQARASLGERFRLAADMPVGLVLTGRSTTFFRFLTEPFIRMFDDALEAA